MALRTLFVLTSEFADVEDEFLGDGVRVTRLPDDLKDRIYEQNKNVISKWEFYFGREQHAIQNTYDDKEKSEAEAEQEIVRAFVALRIIQPSSLGLHLVVTAEESPEGINYSLQNRIGIQTMTYVSIGDANKFIGRADILRAKVLWPSIQKVCRSWQEHKRIMGALRYFEIGCANYDAQIRHILFHSALECLLCTHRDHISQQVRQRVTAVCPEIADKDIRAITNMRGGFVHSGSLVQEAKGRENELLEKLERIVRACLYHALADEESVELYSDSEKLKARFPVRVKKIQHNQTNEEILV
jgi:hypothetical protein